MKKPNIVLLDIETFPMVGYAWQTYDTNITKILRPTTVASVAYKQLGDKAIQCISLPDYRGYKGGLINDEKLIRYIWKVLDDADVVIAHHGDAFDLKRLNARFVVYGLPAPSYYKSIDTRKVAKKHFYFDSNSLDNLADYLGLGRKMNTGGFELWDRCMNGNMNAWAKMVEYNIHDVRLLEAVYLRLRPFMDNHPNLNIIAEAKDPACGTCLGTRLIRRGFAATRAGRKQRYQCQDCGSWTAGAYERYKANEHRH